MITGDIVLLLFPFAELTNAKVRPAVIIGTTADKYKDIIVAAISSVVPESLNKNEILIEPDSINGLRVKSIIKVDRIVTLKNTLIINQIGKLDEIQINILKEKFKKIIDV
jgi:mRNA interferase MazF